jgi:hypothetical protein
VIESFDELDEGYKQAFNQEITGNHLSVVVPNRGSYELSERR